MSHQQVDGFLIDETPTLRLTLYKGQVLYISLDLRTGRFIFRDSGDLAAWERSYKFGPFSELVNGSPAAMLEIISRLRFSVRGACRME